MWEQLVAAGLDPKEAKFYLAVLAMRRSTVAEAAERAGVSRTNAYDITKRMMHRGLLRRLSRVSWNLSGGPPPDTARGGGVGRPLKHHQEGNTPL